MKKTLRLITIFVLTMTSWSDTLFYYNGNSQTVDISEINSTEIIATEKLEKSAVRGITFSKIPTVAKSPQEHVYINETFQRIKKQNKTISDSFFTRREKTFTIKDKYRWSEEIVLTCYVAKKLPEHLRIFNFDFNSQYETISILSASYTDKEGVITPLPEASCTIFSRYLNCAQLASLKRLHFVIPQLPIHTIVNLRILKSRDRGMPFDDFDTTTTFQSRLPVANSKIKVNVPITTPQLTLNHEIFNDNAGLIKYERTKSRTHISRIWSTTEVKIENPITLQLSIGHKSKTKKTKAYSQDLALLVLEVKEKNYMSKFIKGNTAQDIITAFLKRYKLITPSSHRFPMKVEETYNRKSGSAIDLVPLLIAELQFQNLKPELFFMNKGSNTDFFFDDNTQPALRIGSELFFMNQNVRGNAAWSGSCYFGEHISSNLNLPATKLQQAVKTLSVEVNIVPSTKTTPGSITFDLDQKFDPTLLDKFPNAKVVKLDANRWQVVFKMEGSRISHNHLALQLPDLAQRIAQSQNFESIHTTVLLPEQWEVYHLPEDIKGEKFYLPTERGFSIKQKTKRGKCSKNRPILLQLINSDKKWFQ